MKSKKRKLESDSGDELIFKKKMKRLMATIAGGAQTEAGLSSISSQEDEEEDWRINRE